MRTKVFVGALAKVSLGLLSAGLLAKVAMAAVGATQADYGVNQNGAPTYTIPIRVTEGINGLTPSLAISYAGPDTRSILGLGFDLEGISYIRPCAATIAQDGTAAPVTLTSADRYCLDGARLRLVSGSPYGASETIYRTELDQMIRVTAKDSTSGIPGWFKVELPNGLVYEYGSSADAKLLASEMAGASPQFWAVKRVTDRSDNSIVFHYDTNNSLRRHRPNYISYTERAGSGHYRITFVYQPETQPEPATEFTPSNTGGAAHSEDKLLERIELSHDSTVYRKIHLTYQSGAAYNRRLATVQECAVGTPDDCLPPTIFTWQSSVSGHLLPAPSQAVAGGILPLDINGDGIKDLAWAASGTWRYMLGSANGFGAVQSTGLAVINSQKAMVLRWNGDEFDDLLVDWSDGKWRVIKGSANGFLTPAVHAGPGTGIPSNTASTSWTVNDMDGDGLDDLLTMPLNANFNIKVRINSATGFGTEQTAYFQSFMRTTAIGWIRMDGTSAVRRLDFNGDSRGDLLIYGCWWDHEFRQCTMYGWYQLVSNGTTLVNVGYLPGGGYANGPRFADLNSDGLTDVVYAAQSPAKWWVGFGQGSGGLSFVSGPSTSGYAVFQSLLGDYDGDGLHDLYAATSSSPQWHVFRGSSTGLALSPIATGIAASGGGWMLTDQDGDSLPDLGRYDTSTFIWNTYLHAGVPGERLTSTTDGLGNKVSFSYLPMTNDSIYTKGTGAPSQTIDVELNEMLVQVMQIEPAGGIPYFFTYKYADAREHTQGRGYLGMGRREITDSRNGMHTVETYRQDFPYIGALASVTVKQSVSGYTIQSATHTYSNHLLEATPGNQRYLPYRSQTVTNAHEVGGVKNGNLITEITESRTVNTYGNPTFVAVEFKDKDSGSPEFNSIYRTEVTSAFMESEAAWCIGVPTSRSEKRILPGGTNETRATTWDVDAGECRVELETVAPGAGSALSLVTDVDYDSCGNVNWISSYPAGVQSQARTTTINFGTRCQRPESITNPENHTSEVDYNWPLALPSSQSDPNGIVTTLDFDGFGRLRQRNNPDLTDILVSLTACTSGNSWCGKDSSVRVKASQTIRDSANATIRTDEQFLDGFGRARWVHRDSLESGSSIVQTDFDAFGRPAAQSQPYFQGGTIYATFYARDLIGRVTQIDAPVSESQINGRVTGMAYEGRDLKVTDPKSNTNTRRSNVIGQLRAVIDPSPGGTTSYGYHPFGELASISDAASPPNITSWNYSVRGFLTGTTDPDSGSWTYESNAFGEMERIRDAKTTAPAWTTQFTFDKLSRPLTRIEAEGTTLWTWGHLSDNTANNKYIGRLKQIASPGGYLEVNTFDSLGRPTQQAITADGTPYYINLTYAPATGLLDTLEYPTSTSGYRLKLAYEYANGMLKRVKDANSPTVFWEAVSTDAWGHYQDETFGNGVNTFTDFDQASGLMQAREGGLGGGTGLIHSQVNWDLNGNLAQRKDLKLSPAITEDFFYDALNRFDYSRRTVGTGAPATNADVTLDAIGNISWKQGVGSYTYHTTKKRAVTAAGGFTFGYDANGNMTSRNGASIGYTSYNLPAVINAPGGYSSTLFYGAFRNRFKQVAIGPQGAETTIYVAGLLEKVTNGSGTHYRHFIHGGKGTAAIHTRTAGGSNATYYLHRDHLGSPELITDSSGNELVRPSFAAYGERRDGADWDGPIGSGDLSTLAGITRRGFTGHEHLDSVNLIHMNGRVYEPVAARFLGVDPVRRPGLSQDANPYSYGWNNPMRIIDPTGWDEEEGLEIKRENEEDPPEVPLPTPLEPIDVTGRLPPPPPPPMPGVPTISGGDIGSSFGETSGSGSPTALQPSQEELAKQHQLDAIVVTARRTKRLAGVQIDLKLPYPLEQLWIVTDDGKIIYIPTEAKKGTDSCGNTVGANTPDGSVPVPSPEDTYAVIHTHPEWAFAWPGAGDYTSAQRFSVYNINPSGAWVLRHGAARGSTPTVLSGRTPSPPPSGRGAKCR